MPLCEDLVGSFADGEEFLQRPALLSLLFSFLPPFTASLIGSMRDLTLDVQS